MNIGDFNKLLGVMKERVKKELKEFFGGM